MCAKACLWGRGRPVTANADQIGDELKRDQVRSSRNQRASKYDKYERG